MKMIKLGIKERKLLLELLGFDSNNLTCAVCGKKIQLKDCSIMPSSKRYKSSDDTALLCKDLLCMSMYIGDMEDDE